MKKETPPVSYIIYILILIIILISLNYYIFFKIQSVNIDTKKDVEQGQYADLINSTDLLFYGQRLLENSGIKFAACDDTAYCFEYKNDTNRWNSVMNYKTPVLLTDKNIIKISLKNNEGKGGLNIVGKFSDNQVNWWMGRKEFNVYVNGNQLEINTITGIAQSYKELFNQKISQDENGFTTFYLLTDKWGSSILLIDRNGNELKNIKYSDSFSDQKNRGFFPDGKMFLGISTEAYTTLRILDFFGMPQENKKSRALK